MDTAFLIRQYMSSGISGASPLVLSRRRILEPVRPLTWGTPKESRRVTPIWDGVWPFLANLQMWSITSSGLALTQAWGLRRKGIADLAIPLPLPYIRAMSARERDA